MTDKRQSGVRAVREAMAEAMPALMAGITWPAPPPESEWKADSSEAGGRKVGRACKICRAADRGLPMGEMLREQVDRYMRWGRGAVWIVKETSAITALWPEKDRFSYMSVTRHAKHLDERSRAAWEFTTVRAKEQGIDAEAAEGTLLSLMGAMDQARDIAYQHLVEGLFKAPTLSELIRVFLQHHQVSEAMAGTVTAQRMKAELGFVVQAVYASFSPDSWGPFTERLRAARRGELPIDLYQLPETTVIDEASREAEEIERNGDDG